MKITKKICLLFSLASLLVCMSFHSVSVYADELDTTAATETNVKTYCDGKIDDTTVTSILEGCVGNIAQLQGMGFTKEELVYFAENYATSYGYDAKLIDAYANILTEEGIGAYSSYELSSVEYSDDSKEYIDIIAIIKFEKADLKLTVNLRHFDNLGIALEGYAFTQNEAEQSFASKMTEAGMNTLLGMGTVFVVLILISLIIYCFKYISVIADFFTKKDELAEIESPQEGETTIVVEKQPGNDTELIAVIAAAIAASEGTTTDSFVVRSIRKR